MTVDKNTVRHIARLARIEVRDDELEPLAGELNTILNWVEQLNAVNTEGVPPMTSAVATTLKRRADVVNDGGYPDRLLRNAPAAEDGFFAVPKVVE